MNEYVLDTENLDFEGPFHLYEEGLSNYHSFQRRELAALKDLSQEVSVWKPNEHLSELLWKEFLKGWKVD